MKGIDPKWIMWLGLVVTIEHGISGGALSLTNMIPDAWIVTVKAWSSGLEFIGTAIMTWWAAVSSPQSGPLINTPLAPVSKAIIILAVVLGSLFALPGDARAQIKTPGQIQQDIDAALKRTNAKVVNAVSPAAPATALPCTFQMLIHLTPENLLPTINSCIAGKLVTDTQRALTSAQSYGTSGKGDADAVNCLTPALAIFQAGVQVPAVPAVTAPDGTVTTPAVPAQDPGPILLYQKYREFTLSGALTSCQSWFNGPINATIAAGIAGAGTAIAGAALIMPK